MVAESFSQTLLLGCNNRIGQFHENLLNFRNLAKPPHRFDRHRAKICPNPNVLAYSKSPWTGANVHTYMDLWAKYAWKKGPAFLKSHQWRPKKCQNNRFRVPIHFATNCFWPFSLARLLCTKAVMVSAETIGYYKCGAWPKFSTHSRRSVAMSSMNFCLFSWLHLLCHKRSNGVGDENRLLQMRHLAAVFHPL